MRAKGVSPNNVMQGPSLVVGVGVVGCGALDVRAVVSKWKERCGWCVGRIATTYVPLRRLRSCQTQKGRERIVHAVPWVVLAVANPPEDFLSGGGGGLV